MDLKRIKNALISVYYKDQLEPLVAQLKAHGVAIYSTGGTQKALEQLGVEVHEVEALTNYPSILGGRVKTLHPKVFGGILARQEEQGDIETLESYAIPVFDLVVVDLYPFEETVASGASESEIIEKIDIGGIALIRAGAKNFNDVAIISSKSQYQRVADWLDEQEGSISRAQRKALAAEAFHISSHYDTAIQNYFSSATDQNYLKLSESHHRVLRYGENPHQEGIFFGDLDGLFDQLHGKQLSYNNLLDVDAAVRLVADFEAPTFAILKHNNACGLASRSTLSEAYAAALEADPVSAFGGILMANRTLDKTTASAINELFCEVVIAPDFEDEALEVLQSKKNRILLKLKAAPLKRLSVRTVLNGYLTQPFDDVVESKDQLKTVTNTDPTETEIDDLLFANRLVKHTKSNTIVLAKDKQLLASGTGQTSRVDALKQAIHKAKSFDLNLQGSVMASDAFFPFPDCVEIAHEAGIRSVIQPGGSIKDQASIDFCNQHEMSMVFTGIRHFKH